MEELGIGRPSTYAPTIKLLQARDFVVVSCYSPLGCCFVWPLLQYFQTRDFPCSLASPTLEGRFLKLPYPLPFLQDRKYVAKDGRTFIPSSLGRVLSTFLTIYFEKYVDYNFTAALEVSSKQRLSCALSTVVSPRRRNTSAP